MSLLLLFKCISLFSYIASIITQLPETSILLLASFLPTYLLLCQEQTLCLGVLVLAGIELIFLTVVVIFRI